MPVPAPPALRDDIREEALRLAEAALRTGLPVRLMGGVAVWASCPSARRPPYARDYADLDFAAASRAGRTAVGAFFQREGYVPEKLFNALHGAQRLNFAAPDGRWTVDVVFDELNMSHRIDLRDRLSGPLPTLEPVDLLLTKLQVWEINSKDLGDIACLLADHPIDGDAAVVRSPRPADLRPGPPPVAAAQGESSDGARDADLVAEAGFSAYIDVRRLHTVVGADWGLCHTIERNLAKARDHVIAHPLSGTACDAGRQAEQLLGSIASAPKSLAWKARARIGERVRWYETPEEVRHQPEART